MEDLKSSIFKIRRGTTEDANFITNSWMESYRKSDFSKYIPKGIYNIGHHASVKAAIESSIIHVAASNEDDNQIFGWVCVQPGQTKTLHYIYVKHSFRELGIGTALLEASNIFKDAFFFSHLTKGKLSIHLFEKGKYNPYKFFKGEAHYD